MSKILSLPLLVLLASIFALSPFAIDTYLPAIPNIAVELKVNSEWVAITVSLYVFGLALGQLIGGPLSDQIGRRPIMLLGLLTFALGSGLMAIAQSIEWLWLCRMVQALGGGIAIVGVPATIRDHAEGQEAAKLFSLIALIMMLAPSIAPTIGTVLLKYCGWRGIFIALSLFALGVALATVCLMPKAVKQRKTQSMLRGFVLVFVQRNAVGFLLAQAFGYAVLMIFLANASLVYLQQFQVSTELFSMLFLINIVLIAAMNRLNTYLLRTYQPAVLLQAFLSLQLSGITVLVLATLIAPQILWLTIVGFAITLASAGGMMANSSACFLKYFAENAGVASGVLGAVQYGAGALISAAAALLHNDTLWPVVISMLLCSVVALLAARDGAQRL